MPIDFHDAANRDSYSSRPADPDWSEWFRERFGPAGKTVVDIGCGGGIYSRSLARMGARVIGVEPSPVMLEQARASTPDENVRWQAGDAAATSLPAGHAHLT